MDVSLLSEANVPFEYGGTMRLQVCLSRRPQLLVALLIDPNGKQCYESSAGEKFIALLAGRPPRRNAYVRVHDACLTSEAFGSCKCDCRAQLLAAQKEIGDQAARGEGGIIIYTFQEGRNIGIVNKIKAYDVQVLSAPSFLLSFIRINNGISL